MAQHFKKIIKTHKPKTRQIVLVVSHYFKDIGFVPLSPIEIQKKSTREDLVHNYMLARCHYGRYFGVRFNKKGNEPPEPKFVRSPYWISYDWELHKFNAKTKEWEVVTSPMYPGTQDIFEDEAQTTTTEDLYQKIKKLNTTEVKSETTEDQKG